MKSILETTPSKKIMGLIYFEVGLTPLIIIWLFLTHYPRQTTSCEIIGGITIPNSGPFIYLNS
jgi:hypothetical protein